MTGDPASRLREAEKQAKLAVQKLDRDSDARRYAQRAAADAGSALALLDGADVLEDDSLEVSADE